MSIALPRLGAVLRRAAARSSSCRVCAHRPYSSYVFQENDIVLLQKKSDPTARQILSNPLRPGKCIDTPTGAIRHESIIGLPPRAVVSTAKGKGDYRIYKPSLGEYTNLTPRIVTPIYPVDANLIVSLLDLNPTLPPSSPTTPPSPPLEIFEAGTGHGALSLHLARAIHAANPPPPPLPTSPAPTPDADPAVLKAHNDALERWEAYKPTRRAILTTLDTSAKHSAHAKKVVAGFRGGMYAHSVDFHVGSIPDYIASRLPSSSPSAAAVGTADGATGALFDHAILDLPDCHEYIGDLAEAVKEDGTIVVFCPSVTQIIACLERVREGGLPMLLEKTLEIGQGAGVGGREWDVRAVRARAFVRAEEARRESVSEEGNEGTVEESVESSESSECAESTMTDTESTTDCAAKDVTKSSDRGSGGWNMVCRPKVGGRVVGGGFLGVFRRLAV